METAREVAGVLGVPFDSPSCISEKGLGRSQLWNFGNAILGHLDEVDPLMAPDGGESVADIATRFSQVLSSAEMEFHGSAIFIVSHGDPLQIFQAVKETKENPSFLLSLMR
uniref:Uncharacterized protein n=1 Tax=Oryza punctata TaxID=4537 RepID=A0A0E0K9H4_ORYPU